MHGPTIRNCDGVTLIELMVVMAIMGIVTLSLYQLLESVSKSYRMQVDTAERQQQGRVAMQVVLGEARLAGSDPKGPTQGLFSSGSKTAGKVPIQCVEEQVSPEAILEASGTVFHFVADLDGNGLLYTTTPDNEISSDDNEEVRYEWIGPTGKNSCNNPKPANALYRNTGGGAQEVASGIESFALAYYDENGIQLAVPQEGLNTAQRAQIRRIEITLTAKTIQGKLGTALTSEVWIRNMS